MRLKIGLPLLGCVALAGLCSFAVGSAEAQPMPPARPAAAQTLGIEGPVWRLNALRGLDSALLPGGPQSVTAQFEHGRVSGFSGCNRYFGSYSIKDGQLVIGALAGSMMACTGPAMKVEDALHRVFSGSFKPVLEGDRLTLVGADDQPALRFQAEPKASLEGLSSEITGFNNGRQAVVSPKLGSTISISFGNRIVRGYSGCNTFRASYSSHGDAISIGALSTTRRVCSDPALMQQEREFLAALKSTTRWSFSGALLDMHRADGERTLMGTREGG